MMASEHNGPSILDTWPHYVKTMRGQLGSAEQFLDAWQHRYCCRWPALRRQCLQDYEDQGDSWRKCATRWLYPVVRRQAGRMAGARANLLEVIPQIDACYRALVQRAPRMRYVIMVDIGFAGWACDHGRCRTVLLGLAQIARLGWHYKRSLRDLTAHEVAHHVHGIWRLRARRNEPVPGALGELYSEGFAQRMGHLLGGEEWQQAARTWPNWLESCRRQRPRLAAKYLRAIRQDRTVRAFFGDWYQVEGLSMTGYNLGHAFMRWLEHSGMPLTHIAVLGAAELRERAEEFLSSAARSRA